jgi:hypothetical protein
MDHRDEQGNDLFHSLVMNTVSGAKLRPNDSAQAPPPETDAGCDVDIRISEIVQLPSAVAVACSDLLGHMS